MPSVRKEKEHGHYARQRKNHSNVDDADLAQPRPLGKVTCLLDVNTQTILPSRSLSRTPRGDRHPSLVRHRPVKLEIPNFRSQGISGLLFNLYYFDTAHRTYCGIDRVGSWRRRRKGSRNLLGVVDNKV